MLGVSETRTAVLVVVVEGCVLNSVRSGGLGLETLSMGLLLPGPRSLPFCRGRGMGM